MAVRSSAGSDLPFTEKTFYLREFRGRTLAFAACPGTSLDSLAVREVLAELRDNGTGAVLLASDSAALATLLGRPALELGEAGLEGRVWRAMQQGAEARVLVPQSGCFTAVHEVARRLGVMKLCWLDEAGGLRCDDGQPRSFVDLEDLAALTLPPSRAPLLLEIEIALRAGLPAINLCTPDGLADELFTYAGSGTLFTQKGYVEVRRLTIDDFGAALGLVTRGEQEGFLFPRSAKERDAVLSEAYGGFVEGQHLAGIGALLRHGDVGEIASLYTLTRFLGEGIGGHLVRGLCEEAARRGDRSVFACTTTERVAGFFETNGFVRVAADALPEQKWKGYDLARRERVVCLQREV